MQILRHLHTAILVSNLPKAEYFYGQVLGLQKVDRTLKYPGAWYQLGDFQVHLIVHDNYHVELPNQEKWGRNPHIALGVADLDQIKQVLANHSYPYQMSASGRAALFTRDPDGNILEMTQI